jgi:hypothetical protein
MSLIKLPLAGFAKLIVMLCVSARYLFEIYIRYFLDHFTLPMNSQMSPLTNYSMQYTVLPQSLTEGLRAHHFVRHIVNQRSYSVSGHNIHFLLYSSSSEANDMLTK